MTGQPIIIRSLIIPFSLIILSNVLGYFHQLPVFPQLFINSSACVYIGCILGSQISKKGDSFIKVKSSQDQDTIGTKQALRFPIVASVFLFGLYMIYKYVDEKLVNTILTFYFCFTTAISNTQLAFNFFPFPQSLKKVFFKIRLPKFLHGILEFGQIQISIAGILTFIIMGTPIVLYWMYKHWLLNNYFGISFSIIALKIVNLDKFKNGFILLWLLFFYDIFWVYGTDVMVEVAKKVDLPIKVLFPYQIVDEATKLAVQKFSMLGLGDIVLPGVFISLCLKFDIDRGVKGKWGNHKSPSEFKLIYFYTSFIGYILGILQTYAALVIFNHPQPALLFLVPMCTLSTLIVGLIRGQIRQLNNYEVNPQAKNKQAKIKQTQEPKIL